MFPLEPGTSERLVEIQELWIDWLAQVHRGEIDASGQTIERLMGVAGVLGIARLPELAAAASVQAVSFAGAGEFDKAEVALAAGEILGAGSPESAAAHAAVARARGDWLDTVSWRGKTSMRLLRLPASRRVMAATAVHWLIVAVMLAAFSFVGVLMASTGDLLIRDLREFLERSLPAPGALALVVILLLWPVVLPSGLLWLGLYWSVLLWGYGTVGIRVTLVVLWLVLGSLPALVTGHLSRLEFGLSAPLRAVEDVRDGALTGSAFIDLGVLSDLLPESVAVKHFQADLHLQLRQWEHARNLYREVLAVDSDRPDVLADLGTVYFYEGDLDNSIQLLQQAASAPGAPASVYFNLSRALSEQYRFSESEVMLRRANALDSGAVGAWISGLGADQVVRTSGGFARGSEIRRELWNVWRKSGARSSLLGIWRKTLSLPLALALAGPAIAVFLLARRSSRRRESGSEQWFPGLAERFRCALSPGLPEGERGRFVQAGVSLLLAFLIASLPFSKDFGFSRLLILPAGASVAWIVAGCGLGILVVVRFMLADSGSSRGG